MTGQERIRRAMRHEPVDRVPVMCQLAIGHYLLNTDVSPVDLWFTSEGFARALVTLQRRYRFDGILINLPGRDPDWMRHVARIETAPDGSQTVYFRNGDTARCPADDNVQHFAAAGRRRPTIDEVDPDLLYYDDPHALGGLKYPFYFGLEPYRAERSAWWPDYLFRTIDLVRREAGPSVSVHGEIFSPFTQLMELFGYEQALMYLIDEPEKCRAILAAYAQGAADLGVRQAEHGVDAVLISSAFAGAGFISPRQYEQFVLPYEAEVVERIHAAGVPVYTHTCGDIGDRLELLADTGIDGIDTLDPPPLGSVDLADAKRRVGDRVFFKGNIDPVNTLLAKSREEVRRDALWRLSVGSPGGGYILSSACSVSPRVPPENLTVLVEASEAFAAGLGASAERANSL
ncbi:MAG: uroporphyrinogen decarboxylase family protein [Thermoguttaceae bacterium]|nr:uroporphyrinogen decarboxylase family protein [Thermoguttaceae bacterium]